MRIASSARVVREETRDIQHLAIHHDPAVNLVLNEVQLAQRLIRVRLLDGELDLREHVACSADGLLEVASAMRTMAQCTPEDFLVGFPFSADLICMRWNILAVHDHPAFTLASSRAFAACLPAT